MQNQITISQESSSIPMEVPFVPKEEQNKTPFANVVGHKVQKKELLNVLNWFIHSEEWKAKGVSIPKGVILCGRPGNGKSLIIREFIQYAGVPTFIYHGEEDNLAQGVIDLFEQARSRGKAIVVIDELDLLIHRDRQITRALQESIDGVEQTDADILVLAATNDVDEIPDALLRSGRLDKRIEIEDPTPQECLAIFKKTLRDFGLGFPTELDEDETSLLLSGFSFADIKMVVNDIILRNGFGPITQPMFDEAISIISRGTISAERGVDRLQIAIHEAGHAVMAHAYPNFFSAQRLSLVSASGEFRALEVEEKFWPYEKAIADIRISMAGILAEKIIFKQGSAGCASDLERAKSKAYSLFNCEGYSSCWEILPNLRRNVWEETFLKRRRMERKIERFLKKQESATYRYLKKHKEEIVRLGNLLLEKKRLKPSEILSCLA